MAAYVRISPHPSQDQVDALAAAAAQGDVIAVCPMASTMGGRKTMRTRLCHLGLASHIAANLGWSTTSPSAPQPETPPAAPEPIRTPLIFAEEPTEERSTTVVVDDDSDSSDDDSGAAKPKRRKSGRSRW